MNRMHLDEKIENMAPGILMALVAATAFFALFPSWLNFDIISKDGAYQYIPMARQILDGEFTKVLLDNPQLPLFPLIIAGMSTLTGLNLELSGRIITYAAYILAAMGLFRITVLLFKERGIALLAVLFMLTNRQLAVRSVDCLKETLLIACVIWGNYFILEGIWALARKWPYYLAGVSLLLAGALFRSTSLIFLCAWLVMWVFRKREGWQVRAVLFTVPFVLALAAWKLVPDLPIFGKGSYHLGFLFSSTSGIRDALGTGMKVIGSFFSTANVVVILFGLYGLYRLRKSPYAAHVLLTLAMTLLIIVFWRYQSKRYLLAPIVWMYPLCAYFVAEALRSARASLKAFGSFAIVVCLAFWVHLALTPPDPDKLARKESGEWILSRLGPDQEILSNRDVLVFYAQGKPLPLSSFDEESSRSLVLAIDVLHEDGKALEAKMLSLGRKPDRRFRTISVYLPHAMSTGMPVQ